MSDPDRPTIERAFHDRQAAERARSFADDRERLRFRDEEYLDHETWVRPAFDSLGDLAGRSALDYGCGHGMAAVVMARRGANVSGFDISEGYVREAAARAAANNVPVELLRAEAESLPFPDASFDRVWGCAILHHLDLRRAGAELWRVMRPGGVAVFCEPWGENPFLELARRFAPYPGKHRTRDEEPLRRRDLRVLRESFPSLEVRGFQLLGAARRVWRRLGGLDSVDRSIVRRFPGSELWCRYVVVRLGREE